MTWLIAEIFISLIIVGYLVGETKIVRLVMSIFESSPTFLPQEANPDEDAEIVEILTEDGVRLSGCLYAHSESESRGVIAVRRRRINGTRVFDAPLQQGGWCSPLAARWWCTVKEVY